jgi:hypothetical protein
VQASIVADSWSAVVLLTGESVAALGAQSGTEPGDGDQV